MKRLTPFVALLFLLAGCQNYPCLRDPDEMFYSDPPDFYEELSGKTAEQAEQLCDSARGTAVPVVSRQVLERERRTETDLVLCTYSQVSNDGDGRWKLDRVLKETLSDDWWDYFLRTHVPGEKLPFICGDDKEELNGQRYVVVDGNVYRARNVICDIGVVTGHCPDNPTAV